MRNYSDLGNFYALSALKYFNAESDRIKCNAAILVGGLIGAVGVEDRKTISLEQICVGFAMLMREPNADVRLCAADACANFIDY